MYNWAGIIMAAGFAAAVLTAACGIGRARAFAPRENVFTLIMASGHADGLEQTARGLLGGNPATHIIITDCGLDEYGRKLAELLTRDMGECALICPEELPGVLEAYGWTRSLYR